MKMKNTRSLRDQFAEIASEAYLEQYGSQPHPVMDEPVIDYDTEGNVFGWGSSLTPTSDTDIRVDTLEEGCFGNFDVTDPNAKRLLREYIANDADDYWTEILAQIA